VNDTETKEFVLEAARNGYKGNCYSSALVWVAFGEIPESFHRPPSWDQHALMCYGMLTPSEFTDPPSEDWCYAHGSIYSMQLERHVKHAWAETGRYVFDVENGLVGYHDEWYAASGAQRLKCYTRSEMLRCVHHRNGQHWPTKGETWPWAVAGRNDPCPCGSGLKCKRCCGR
jgi:hypothetical protein